MALAAFKCLKCTGTNAAVETDCSKVPNLLSVDAVHTTPSEYPIKRPPTLVSHPTYSYEMWLRWECTSAPDNACEDFRIYGPASQPDAGDTPGNCLFVTWGTTDTGATPVDTASSVATVSQYEASGSTGYFSPSTALSIGVDTSSGQISSISDQTDYLVAQLKVTGGAQLGDMENQIWILIWEES